MNIKIYTKTDCTVCSQLKQYMEKKNMPFEEKNIKELMNPATLADLSMRKIYIMSAPVLQIDNEFHTTGEFSTQNVLDIVRLENIIGRE